MLTPSNPSSSVVTIAVAARIIGDDDRPIGDDVVRKAAKRIGALERDDHGRAAVRLDIVHRLKEHYARSGYLTPRGVRTVAQLETTK